MRIRTIALASASFTALAVSVPAAAQQAPADPPVEAQTNPADPAPAADAPADEGETIVVTGLRRSLQSAQNIKRNSDQIVDAIVAEDIGKLPDQTVSDTAARIPGIQVERSGGEASRVLVRGLDRFFYATTYNGREIFTAETRSVALQDFPSGAIAAVEAFKTSTADLVEPGLAGLVNVRSRRPLDFKGLEIAGSTWALFPNQSEKPSLNGNILAANRWNVGSGGAEIGALLGFSYTQLQFKDSTRRHGFFVANTDVGRSPDWPEIQYNQGNRWRPSVNGTVQFRSGDLQLYAEGLWQGYREEQTDRIYTQPLWNCGEASYSNIVYRPGTNQVFSGTVNRPGCNGFGWGIAGNGTRKTNTTQFAVGGSYDAGPLKLTADIARTRSKFRDLTESIDSQLLDNDNLRVDWYNGAVRGNGPTFRVSGVDLRDSRNWGYRGFYEEYQFARGDDWQGRLDAEYETGIEFLPRLQIGIRGVDRNAAYRAGKVYWDRYNSGIRLEANPLTWELFSAGFEGDKLGPNPTTWFAPTFESTQANLAAFRQFNIAAVGFGNQNDGFGDQSVSTANGPNMDPRRTYSINEQSIAGYGQANFGFDAGSVKIDGRIGMRVVRTDVDLSGARTVQSNALATPVNLKNRYTDWLPNFNVRADFSNGLVMRFAATQTRTRPEFFQLNPSINFGAPVVCGGTGSCIRNAGGGNPYLRPIESNNLDGSIEYYFARSGFASVSVFNRDLKNYILQDSYIDPVRDPAGAQVLVSGPINSGRGRIRGIEAQIRTFFDFDFLPAFVRNFGIEANVTRLDAKTDQNTPGNILRRLVIPDTSKWVANLTGMYEAKGFTSRLSYNWRSSFREGPLVVDGQSTRQGRGRPISRLDLSNSYAFSDKFTVFADWSNILETPFRSDIQWTNYTNNQPGTVEDFPLVVRFEESIISTGIRFRF